ncbi:MAG TPA: right-handed parallel beta-helix repeat-containing protein [Bryobacteraceae bacterium]|nr:right-handed parallel beta-helix repeat-containing protein [Bryobacteraceae bacterium]
MPRRIERLQPTCVRSVLGAVLLFASWPTLQAATLCVNPAGSSGCQTTIGKAVTAASPGDTIQVAAGTYKEDVTIGMRLSLVGAGSDTTIIDATGLANGIVVDGVDNPGLSGVVITGFTVQNANFQGILVENASNITIWANQILKNDLALTTSGGTPTCPGLPPTFQQSEGDDCGEGLHFTGVDHSVVTNNVIESNSGGFLITDDTGPTFDNVVTGNVVMNNVMDCGITIASHSGKGVYQNTISDNTVVNNGTKGQGAGVGIFAPGPGSNASGNVVVNNTITNNGLPGVTMHNHAAPPGAPAVNMNDNIIVGNTISGNGADTDDAATPGTAGINIFSKAPVTGTVISENSISGEHIGVEFNAPSGGVQVSLNNILAPLGINNANGGTVNAGENWWGCASGPNVGGCSLTSGSGVTLTPPLGSAFSSTQLPKSPTAPPPTGPTGITIVITGPRGAISSTNTFQVFLNQVTLNASGSMSGNAGPLTYSWSVAPGSPAGGGIVGANTATPTFQLTTPQTYQYTLTVTDSTGATATTTVTVQYI